MSVSRALHLSPRQRRTFISYLFAFTAAASIITVSASNVLPCPAHATRGRFADGEEREGMSGRRKTIVEKRPRRWIEEKNPTVSTP